MTLELVARHDFRVGEGPLWHADEAVLYWVDIKSGRLFRYDPETGADEEVLALDGRLGGFTIQADGSLLLFGEAGAVGRWDRADEGDETAVEWLIESIPGEEDSRFNDVIADPEGRVFAGTMPTDDGLGTLYRIDPDGSYERVDVEGYAIPNGMGFTPDRETMYVTESEAYTIYQFDYDRETGVLSNKRPFVEVPATEGAGIPDGMTVDETGHVWSARWGGHCVVRYDPDGNEVDRLSVPVPKASCVTFGGPDYDDLYVSTAKGHDREDDAPAGSLFRGTVGVGGVPEFRSRIAL